MKGEWEGGEEGGREEGGRGRRQKATEEIQDFLKMRSWVYLIADGKGPIRKEKLMIQGGREGC